MKIAFTCNSNNFISQAIQFVTKDKSEVFPVASHCLPILGELYGLELGLSADELLISIVDVNRYRNDPDSILRIYEIPDAILPEVWIRKVVTENNQKVYPHAELFWFIYEWAKNQVFPDDPNDKNWLDYSVFCSELTVKALQAGGYSGWFKGFDPNSITPAELEGLVIKIPHCILIEEKNPLEMKV